MRISFEAGGTWSRRVKNFNLLVIKNVISGDLNFFTWFGFIVESPKWVYLISNTDSVRFFQIEPKMS